MERLRGHLETLGWGFVIIGYVVAAFLVLPMTLAGALYAVAAVTDSDLVILGGLVVLIGGGVVASVNGLLAVDDRKGAWGRWPTIVFGIVASIYWLGLAALGYMGAFGLIDWA